MPVRMELSRILIHDNTPSHIIELREVGGERVFPIWIGQYEAAAIERRLSNRPVSRPQTHELLSNVIRDLGGQLDHILVNDLIKEEPAGGTFMAQLVINTDGKQVKIDSRPSDAIALGIATDVPIYVAEHVIDQASKPS